MDIHMKKHSANKVEVADRFDRERDIVGRTMDAKSRDQMLRDSKLLDDKFTSGKKTFL